MKLRLPIILAALMLACTAFGASAQTLTSDQPDYAPGSTATFTGAGFQPGETVTMRVVHATAVPDTGANHFEWTVQAGADGGFVTTWHVCEDDCVGETLRATAHGESSNLYAELLALIGLDESGGDRLPCSCAIPGIPRYRGARFRGMSRPPLCACHPG